MEVTFRQAYAHGASPIHDFTSVLTGALAEWLRSPHPYAAGLLIAFSVQEVLFTRVAPVHGQPLPLEAYASLLIALLLTCPHLHQTAKD